VQPLLFVLVPLLAAVLCALEIHHRRARRRLERLARTDPLTGLPNRRAWHEHLQREIARSMRYGSPVSVGLVDLDHFKVFNDRHGHQAGDRLLRALGGEANERLRATDLLARYGGEEFALILPGCPIERAHDIVERLREGVPADQTCSAGVAMWDGRETLDDLMARADTALYEAKRKGRNRTELAHHRRNGDSAG